MSTLSVALAEAARVRVATNLTEQPKRRAGCMTCGAGLDPEKAARGGRNRFCSGRCLSYFDAGWQPNRGPAWMVKRPETQDGRQNTFDTSKSGCDAGTFEMAESSSSKNRNARSEAQKRRHKQKRKSALADSWKRYQAKQLTGTAKEKGTGT
jgi:hypothetical protein